MQTAILDEEDEKYLTHLEELRENYMHAPLLSEFKVLALLAFEQANGIKSFVVGANCECANIGGALCAERAALCQLQLLPVKKIYNVYIVSDAETCLTPGTLCREFLSSSPYFSDETPFIFRARNCSPCTTTLKHLYPFPSIYSRIARRDIIDFAKRFRLNSIQKSQINNWSLTQELEKKSLSSSSFKNFIVSELNPIEVRVYKTALEVTKYDCRDDLFPIRYGAAVLFEDGEIRAAWQHKTLEYGSSLDAVSKLIPFIEEKQLKSPLCSGPQLILGVDQFGILHAPVGRARAYFAEFDHHHKLQFIIHDAQGKLCRVQAKNLVFDSPIAISRFKNTRK
jgi:cytidine deaminase